ncbi:MAG: pyridoxal phosphate-dependent aminotransferase [Candidatus Krumholzibacteria bacterium]|jgi:aspartate/methionine/tyrosine aminotransferase|nr:pyridoxal phosphate-dependent aminotransferase [Candidatus Krumholzibacteria bacterium]
MDRTVIESIKPFMVMEVLERALELEKKGRSIIHMEIGEPDFPTPRKIVQAGIESLLAGDTHYTDSRGISELRLAISEYCGKRYGAAVDPDRVIVTMGVSPALLLVLSSLVENDGDEIIMGNPCYPCYPNFTRYVGARPKFIPTREEEGFQLKPADVEKAIGPATRAVMINSPANPTGTLIPPEDIEAIVSLGVPVISDEIYHGLVYGEREHSALEFSDECYVLNGFSKLFAMTGWRLGYAILPEGALRRIQILQQNFFICPGSFVQRAAVAALRQSHPEIGEMVALYDERRLFLLGRLDSLGLRCAAEPKGAFYIFVRAGHLDNDSHRLAFDILEKAGVALTPGIDFGERGEGYLRISYANSLENLKEGMDRLEGYLEGRRAV